MSIPKLGKRNEGGNNQLLYAFWEDVDWNNWPEVLNGNITTAVPLLLAQWQTIEFTKDTLIYSEVDGEAGGYLTTLTLAVPHDDAAKVQELEKIKNHRIICIVNNNNDQQVLLGSKTEPVTRVRDRNSRERFVLANHFVITMECRHWMPMPVYLGQPVPFNTGYVTVIDGAQVNQVPDGGSYVCSSGSNYPVAQFSEVQPLHWYKAWFDYKEVSEEADGFNTKDNSGDVSLIRRLWDFGTNPIKKHLINPLTGPMLQIYPNPVHPLGIAKFIWGMTMWLECDGGLGYELQNPKTLALVCKPKLAFGQGSSVQAAIFDNLNDDRLFIQDNSTFKVNIGGAVNTIEGSFYDDIFCLVKIKTLSSGGVEIYVNENLEDSSAVSFNPQTGNFTLGGSCSMEVLEMVVFDSDDDSVFMPEYFTYLNAFLGV